jgi:hypothetical protein
MFSVITGTKEKSQAPGVFGLLDFTALRSVLARRVLKLMKRLFI